MRLNLLLYCGLFFTSTQVFAQQYDFEKLASDLFAGNQKPAKVAITEEDNKIKVKGEYYVSLVYNLLVSNGFKISIYEKSCICFSPTQIKAQATQYKRSDCLLTSDESPNKQGCIEMLQNLAK